MNAIFSFVGLAVFLTSTLPVAGSSQAAVMYVDDDASADPGVADSAVSDPLEDGSPQHPFDMIQEGINAACDGDTVLVLPGTYYENIDFNGAAITVRSAHGADETTIDATGLNASVVKCVNGEGAGTILEGFTITGGSGETSNSFAPGTAQGGGMLNEWSSPTVVNCVFRNNRTEINGNDGGGMLNYESSPTLTGCLFLNNSTRVGYGGGMFNRDNSSPVVLKCGFIGNSSGQYSGGGMANHRNSSPAISNTIFVANFATGEAVPHGGAMQNRQGSNPTLVNCTLLGNVAGQGGGIYNENIGAPSVPMITNCVFWDNSDSSGMDESAQIHDAGTGISTVGYSTIQGLDSFAGNGNIYADPQFVDADGIDNIPGTEDDNARLLSSSPCIDAGDSSAVTDSLDLDCNPRTVNEVVDMGAYEFQLVDSDGDGIPDEDDACPFSILHEFITIDDCATDVDNILFDDGCTTSDLIDDCANNATTHGAFVSCVADLTNGWKQDGLITGREKGQIQSCAAQSDIGFGCTDHADCDDGVFCNGVEMCLDGECITGDPCQGQWCDEALDDCFE